MMGTMAQLNCTMGTMSFCWEKHSFFKTAMFVVDMQYSSSSSKQSCKDSSAFFSNLFV